MEKSIVRGDVIVQFGLASASPTFRAVVSRFIAFYLGDDRTLVPFGGRDREIGALNTWLADHPAEAEAADLLTGAATSNNLLITAPVGRGKTALLVRWLAQLGPEWPVVFIPVSIRYQTNQAVTFYNALAARLAALLNEGLSEPRTDPATYYREKVIEYLDRIASGGQPCLVVVDGLDEARGWKLDTGVLPANTPPTLKIVVSARELAGDRGSEAWLARLGWRPPQSAAKTMRVPLLDRDGVRDVLARTGFPLAQLAGDDGIVDELYRLTELGDPLLLQLYAHDLMGSPGGAARLTPHDLRKLKPGFGEYFRQWLEEQREEWRASGVTVDAALLDAILAVLACAFGPLKLADLEELVGRIHPNEALFTTATIDPLRRFILGDGVAVGYALSHPKLANYLQDDYFGGGRTIAKTEQAMLRWMAETVEALNAGRLRPDRCPEYALLFYTQHLGHGDGGDQRVAFRALVDDGWRKAWESYEGGFQGFHRDVELASRAFRAAVDADPAQLQAPNVGLGALIRCALCVSSIRSFGAGVSGELLVEFLRSGSITPKQALYLVQMKGDDGRAKDLPLLFPYLDAELQQNAIASMREVKAVGQRLDALTQVLEYMPPADRRALAEEAVRVKDQLGYNRYEVYQRLKDLLPEDIWSVSAYEPLQAPVEEGAAPLERDGTADAEYRLMLRVQSGELPEHEIGEVLEQLGRVRVGTYLRVQILRSIAPRLSPAQGARILEQTLAGDDLWRGETLVALAPALDADAATRALRGVVTTHTFSSDATTLIERCRADDRATIFQEALASNSFGRLGVMTELAKASPELRPALIAAIEKQDGYGLERVLRDVLSGLTADETVAIVKSLAFKDIDDRGRALSVLAPHIRELGIPLEAVDAYRMSFTISDRAYRELAIAALAPAGARRPDVQAWLAEPSRAVAQSDFVVETLSVLLSALQLAEPERVALLEARAARAKALVTDPETLLPILALLGSQLGRERGQALRDETAGFAVDGGNTTIATLTATLLAPGEAQALLTRIAASREAAAAPSQDVDALLLALIETLLPAATPDASMGAAFLEKVYELSRQAEEDDEHWPVLLIGMLLAPAVNAASTARLVADLRASVPAGEVESEGAVLALACSYLGADEIRPFVGRLLDVAATQPRQGLLAGLSFVSGAHRHLWPLNPEIGANVVAGSPLARVGGDAVVAETIQAIEDVCAWWP